jgi:hypothetical protein
MRYLTGKPTGEYFLAREMESGFELSGPVSYRDVAQAVQAERAGESFEFDGELVESLAGLVDMSESELRRCEDEAAVQGVKIGSGWLPA